MFKDPSTTVYCVYETSWDILHNREL